MNIVIPEVILFHRDHNKQSTYQYHMTACQHLQINFYMCFLPMKTVKSFLPAMKKRNHGHIVTIASIAGLVGCNNLVDYCASKFANVGFNESLSLELFEENLDGIHTTVVCPYYIDTGMFAGCKTRYVECAMKWDSSYIMSGTYFD